MVKLRIVEDECPSLYFVSDKECKPNDLFSECLSVDELTAAEILQINKLFWDTQKYIEKKLNEASNDNTN